MERIDSSRPQRSQRAGAGRTMATAALAGGTALLAVALPPTAAAQPAFPDRPLRLIVHVPPGGALDFTARVVGSKLTESLGQQVLVENRAGAGGIAASELVSKATPDGHTLLLSSSTSHGVAPVLYRKLPYDAFRDFTHVALVAILPALMAINADLPAKTVKE
ncbi:MAG: Bug family tripartite tricarboxylate transporter substrate binding protein, partial [bacterium]